MASHHRVYYRCDDGRGMDALFRDLTHDVQLTFMHGPVLTLKQVQTSNDIRYADMTHRLIVQNKQILWTNGRNAKPMPCYADDTMLMDQSIDHLSSPFSEP